VPDASWMKNLYSVYLRIDHGGTTMYCWSTPEPMLLTSEEAMEMVTNVRAKVQSVLVHHRAAIEGFLTFTRSTGYGSHLTTCVDECIIPATVLANAFVRYTLVQHKS